MTLVKANITQESIDRNMHFCNNCPVHDAIEPLLDSRYTCRVGQRIIGIAAQPKDAYVKEFLWQAGLPNSVVTWIRFYDHPGNVAGPTTFEIDIPQEYLK